LCSRHTPAEICNIAPNPQRRRNFIKPANAGQTTESPQAVARLQMLDPIFTVPRLALFNGLQRTDRSDRFPNATL
jgi:hypothetical protein